MTNQTRRPHPAYGPVLDLPVGEMSRRTFMRRMLGWGVGLLSLEFVAGSIAFLWPNLTSGLGADIAIGSAKDIVASFPAWATGEPYLAPRTRTFFVNVPAAKDLVLGKAVKVPDPRSEVLALYRKCPHLGCQIPQLCDKSHWFECLCHGSKYTILGEKRAGPAPRGLDRFPTTMSSNGGYVLHTGRLVSGPPIGTATFDTRDTSQIQHCTS